MNNIPDVVGYPLEVALDVLKEYNHRIVIKETIGKKQISDSDKRVLRQNLLEDNKLQLIISYFKPPSLGV